LWVYEEDGERVLRQSFNSDGTFKTLDIYDRTRKRRKTDSHADKKPAKTYDMSPVDHWVKFALNENSVSGPSGPPDPEPTDLALTYVQELASKKWLPASKICRDSECQDSESGWSTCTAVHQDFALFVKKRFPKTEPTNIIAFGRQLRKLCPESDWHWRVKKKKTFYKVCNFGKPSVTKPSVTTSSTLND
jgi:hypothetical protein